MSAEQPEQEFQWNAGKCFCYIEKAYVDRKPIYSVVLNNSVEMRDFSDFDEGENSPQPNNGVI